MELKPIAKDMEFVVDGVVLGRGTMFIENGQMDTTNLDDEFFKTMRKHSKSLVEEAEDEQKFDLIEALTAEQERKLKETFAANYTVLDDDLSDAFEDWLREMSAAQLFALL